ncbi:MAG: DUF885 domain-containing protein [Candidatus Neomarinimicrobiota bacterium]
MRNFVVVILFVHFQCSSKPDIESIIPKNLDTQQFHQLLDRDWEKTLGEYPEWATQLGDNRFNHLLNDVSYESILKRHKEILDLFNKVKFIDRNHLSVEDQLNYDLFIGELDHEIKGFNYLSYLMPIDQMGGIQISFAGISNYMPFRSIDDYQNYMARMRAFPKKVNQIIDLMRRGIDAGWVPPKIILSAVPNQIKAQFETEVEESPLFMPFTEFHESISLDDQNNLSSELKQIIEIDVYGSYRSLFKFFDEEYIPNCRNTIACIDFPNGENYYEYLIKGYTTTDLTARQIHEIGLEEVARIRIEMIGVMEISGFDGGFSEFLNFLRTNPDFFYDTEEEFLDAYRSICKKADAQLPKFFGRLPRLPYGIKAIPEYQAPASPTAYYYPGSQEAGRSGYFMANTYKLDTRPKYEMEALSMHEAVPGHHLQISLAQELDDIPMFRRHGGYTAFVEGWGLYSEKLAEEMGFYKDSYSKFGQLTYEMWRACRLVVDTGMHALGWTREQAIEFMSVHTAKTDNDIRVEIDRYIAWPAQALAYKIGELKILELRKNAEKRLGQDFNIREFHDVVLGDGAVPLDILAKQVDEYIISNIK